MFGFIFGRQDNGVFEAKYRVYPVSFIGKNDAENGDKIFMPPSALDKLGILPVPRPRQKLFLRPSQEETQGHALSHVSIN